MELPRRARDDVCPPDGEFRRRVRALQRLKHAHDLRIGLVYAFDFRTRMLPFWYADKRMAPCSVRLLADVLHEAGFPMVDAANERGINWAIEHLASPALASTQPSAATGLAAPYEPTPELTFRQVGLHRGADSRLVTSKGSR